VTLPVTILTLRKEQTLQQNAQTATPPACVSTLPLKVPVVVLGYFPPAPGDPTHLDPVETGWTQQRMDSQAYGAVTIPQWEDDTRQMAANMSQDISNATKYHGYKDPSAPMFLNYQVIDTKFFTQALPHTPIVAPGEQAVRPDYAKVLTSVNVCNYVDNLGVKEFWIYGYHSDVVSPDEARLSSKYGDISNSAPHEQDYPPEYAQYKLPVCNNSYIMFNFEYGPDPTAFGNTVHIRLHQIENEIGYAEDSSSWPPTKQNTAGTMFWGNFSQEILDGDTNTPKNSCGTTHFAINWRTTADVYRYDLQNMQQSNCETWNPDPTKSTYKPINCTAWGCTDIGWYNYWMQNIPGYNNGITYQGKPMRNWWEAMYDFNTFIAKGGRTLLGNSNLTCPVTPTPVVTATPTPIPTPTSIIPTNVCLGSCPVPEDTPTPTIPLPSTTITPTPTSNLNPCTTTQSVTAALQTTAKHSRHKHNGNSNANGLLEALLNFIKELLQLIGQLLGNNPNPNPTPTPTPLPTSVPSSPPSTAPCPSSTPISSTAPSTLTPTTMATPTIPQTPTATITLTNTPTASPTIFATPTSLLSPTSAPTPTTNISPTQIATPTLFATTPTSTSTISFAPTQTVSQSPEPTNAVTTAPTPAPSNNFAAQVLQLLLNLISLILKFFASLFH
jgi:hypothetical protein